MILITQFWNFENTKRREEIYKCLLNNAMNRYITKIYVFSEDNSYINFQHNKIVPLKANHRLSYFEMFKSVNQSFRNQICIVSNADIYFDESIVKINQINFKNKIIALSSYDSETKLIEDYSFDSWILKSINLPYNEYSIGKSHDDLRLLKNLKEHDIEIINPSKEIFSYHIDSNKKLKYVTTEQLDYIEPSTLIEAPLDRKHTTYNVIEPISDNYNNNNKANINIVKNADDINIAVHLHLYYHDLWDEFSILLNNLKGYKHDIYVTITKDSTTLGQITWIKNKIENEFKNATIIEVDNKGLDIGAFLMILEHILDNNYYYDYILKLHSKKSVKTSGIEFGTNWRKQLYKPLIGNTNTVEFILNKFKNDKIGMIGNKTWVSDYQGLNKSNIDTLKTILNIKTNNKRFIGGTMFWVKYPILKKYFTQNNISKIVALLENGYFTDYDYGTYTHALERVIGYIVSDSNKIIEGVQ